MNHIPGAANDHPSAASTMPVNAYLEKRATWILMPVISTLMVSSYMCGVILWG